MASSDEILKTAFGDKGPAFKEILNDTARVNFEAYKYKVEHMKPIFERRGALAKDIPKFWYNSLVNCGSINPFIDNADIEPLSHLTNVEFEYEEDVRNYSIVFTFDEANPNFKNTKLVKRFTVTPPGETDAGDVDPYDLEAPLYGHKTEIAWTSDEHNLVKKSPRVNPEELEEFDEFTGSGSFFNWFLEEGPDTFELADMFLEWWSGALEYAAGINDDDDVDSEEFDSEEESDDDPNKVIDLEDSGDEQPKKRAKTG